MNALCVTIIAVTLAVWTVLLFWPDPRAYLPENNYARERPEVTQ